MNFDVVQIEAKTVKTDVLLIFVFANQKKLDDNYLDLDCQLNNEISNDSRLGKQFQIGHSFFTPTESIKNKDSKSWFNEVVESEIKPLLEEHWFDAPEEVEKSIKKLITD